MRVTRYEISIGCELRIAQTDIQPVGWAKRSVPTPYRVEIRAQRAIRVFKIPQLLRKNGVGTQALPTLRCNTKSIPTLREEQSDA